ncbi:substrate-binding domain-containing protein [Tardiphaga sp. P9-11]|jgi:LacI family transcriptional regulator|uniref:LacI family DNA-binding transcriptional regulator n=1 Tax=Tardiphaga sp. P9-11 TaxID=2024614 RepID=UPI0011F12C29|nr:substrate-binding domain-containing protein [Tardiphaga sp. P9-11]KAA0073855.1 LacI family transcriptional regulator [Tardiphaga sp. P9-11]
MTTVKSKPQGSTSRLAEVARLASVSPATVSRAFNTPDLLNADTLRRVTEAATQLNYTPDGLARSLRRNRSMVIGAVMPALRHAYFASTVEGLQSEIAKRGYTLLLAISDFDEATELAAVRSMIRQGVDGFVLVGMRHDAALLPLLRDLGKPFVITWSYNETVASVGFDHRKAIQPVVNHLLDLGHRDMVATMAFLNVSDRERDRLAGIEDAFAQRGLPFPAERVIYAGNSGLQDGRNAFRTALARFPDVTAVICANDLLAAGTMMECAARGLSVPRDISVVGYGDLDIAAAMNPAITTVRTPAHEMGRLAASTLLTTLAGEDGLKHIELTTELIVRGSTGPAKSTGPKRN